MHGLGVPRLQEQNVRLVTDCGAPKAVATATEALQMAPKMSQEYLWLNRSQVQTSEDKDYRSSFMMLYVLCLLYMILEFKCVSVFLLFLHVAADRNFLNLQALQSMALDAAAALMLAQTRQAALYFRAPEALERLSIISWISCSFCHNSHTPGNCTAFLRCPNQHEDIWFCSVSMGPKH